MSGSGCDAHRGGGGYSPGSKARSKAGSEAMSEAGDYGARHKACPIADRLEMQHIQKFCINM